MSGEGTIDLQYTVDMVQNISGSTLLVDLPLLLHVNALGLARAVCRAAKLGKDVPASSREALTCAPLGPHGHPCFKLAKLYEHLADRRPDLVKPLMRGVTIKKLQGFK